MTDFSLITACGESCADCPKKADGRCPGCIEADGYVPEWEESGRCRIHACTREHHVQFCGLCPEFPCGRIPSLISWNPNIIERMTALKKQWGETSAEKQAILLNGPSSSGKSTLSGALRETIGEKRSERYEVISIDDFMEGSPMEKIYEDDVFAISGNICDKALDTLAKGSGVIIDHVITSERIFTQLKEALRDYPLRTVHITCPAEVLREREQARGDRCPGSAEDSAEYLFPKDGYDLTVDTSEGTPETNAALIFRALFDQAGTGSSTQQL